MTDWCMVRLASAVAPAPTKRATSAVEPTLTSPDRHETVHAK
jgi:hypothetical protein